MDHNRFPQSMKQKVEVRRGVGGHQQGRGRRQEAGGQASRQEAL